MILVRRADAADHPVIVELCASVPNTAVTPEGIRLATERGSCFVAVVDGAPVGFLMKADWFFDRQFIALVAVHPSHRRHGIATLLIRHIESTSAGDVFASTNRSNTRMRRLLEKLGFEECGYIDRLDPGDPEIFYVSNGGRKPDEVVS